jgi:hypothetical protein
MLDQVFSFWSFYKEVIKLNRNKKAINALNVDDIVLFKVDDVDRGAADPPNIVCVILEKNESMFKLGHKGGVLKEWFPFNVPYIPYKR